MPKKSIPRFVLSLVDTKTTIQGPKGEQYYSVNVGFNKVSDLFKPIAEEDGGTELQRVIDHFEETVKQFGARKGGASKKFTQLAREKEEPEQ